jgi:hypothetical protein
MSDGTRIAWCNATLNLRHGCSPAGVDLDSRVSHDPAEWDPALRVREWPGVRHG